MSLWTADDLAKVERAIRGGARRIRIGGREVEHYSLAELRELRAEMKRELSGGAKIRRTRVRPGRG